MVDRSGGTAGERWYGLVIWYGIWCVFAGIIVITVALALTPSDGWLHRVWRKSTSMFPSNASGTITVSGVPGDYTMHVTSCYSGERRQFFGVTFFDEDQPKTGGRLILPVDSDGSVMLNNLRGSGSEEFYAQDCKVWDAEVHHGMGSYNRIRNFKGHARFECVYHNPETHVTGDLTFRNCH